MKTRTRKALIKRFDVTGTGKLKHNAPNWNHLRMKKSTKVHQRKARSRVLQSARQTRQIKSGMGL